MRRKIFAVLLAAATAALGMPAGIFAASVQETEIVSDGGASEELEDAILVDAEEGSADLAEEEAAADVPEDGAAGNPAEKEDFISDGERVAADSFSDDSEDDDSEDDDSRDDDSGDDDSGDDDNEDGDGEDDGSGDDDEDEDDEDGQDNSGDCGDNLTWALTETETDGYTLTISGSGDMYDYSDECSWLDYADSIETISFDGKITSVGGGAFYGCEKVTSISLPDSVTSIGEEAFTLCEGLTGVSLPSGVTIVEDSAFSDCTSLTYVSVPVSMKSLGEDVFYECNSLADIYYQGTPTQWYALTGDTDLGIESQKTTIHYESTGADNPGFTVSDATLKVNLSGTLSLKTKQRLKKLKVTMLDGDSVVSWKSSNTKIVKVSGRKNGSCTIIAQKKTGKATITIKLASGLSKKINVKVQNAAVATKSITGVSSKLTLKKGKSAKLSVTLNPISSTDKITYTTSDQKIATVSSAGVIKAKKKGTATITIKAGKKTKTVKVTVK